ncbi:MAG: hypothetical protein ACFBSF_01135 [Leptolyngbyaceae cyanobacterium]
MSRKGQAYGPGRHPHSQDNLRPRERFYDEVKKSREITVTPTGWAGFKAIAQGLELSASELVERIGRGVLVVGPPSQFSGDD